MPQAGMRVLVLMNGNTNAAPTPGAASIANEENATNAPVAPLDGAHVAPPAMDRRYIVAALMTVMVLASMEQTITSTAMPTIIGDLRGFEHYSWVFSIYLLALTVSMPLYGRLADVLGRKRVILGAIFIFSVASTSAAFAHTMGQLICFRGL